MKKIVIAIDGFSLCGEDHDGKGLHYKKQDCPDVHLNWENVAKRITSLVQKGRYLTEQEQAQYNKIQAEKELAEEDAIQTQQPEIEEETPKPILREQFEQYKPVMPTNLYGPNDNFHLENSHVMPAMMRKIYLAKLTSWALMPENRVIHSASATSAET